MDATVRLTTLTRLGFAARGLLYIVIALLVIQTGRAEDSGGALAYLERGGGRPLLLLMAVGFAAYGLWRLADAAFNVERHSADGKGMAQRAGAGGSGIVHLLLAWQTVRLASSAGAGAAAGDSAQEGARTTLALPGGTLLLTIAGLVLVGVGLYQLVKAARGSFLKHLEPQMAGRDWVQWTGRLGYAARGLVFLISGYFLVDAGLAEQAGKAGGIDRALAWLNHPWDLLVAVGLLAFGLFSLIEARFRILHDVPVAGLARRAGRHWV